MYKGGKGGYSVGIYSAQFSQLLYNTVYIGKGFANHSIASI
jgi:hypothetical protein